MSIVCHRNDHKGHVQIHKKLFDEGVSQVYTYIYILYIYNIFIHMHIIIVWMLGCFCTYFLRCFPIKNFEIPAFGVGGREILFSSLSKKYNMLFWLSPGPDHSMLIGEQ